MDPDCSPIFLIEEISEKFSTLILKVNKNYLVIPTLFDNVFFNGHKNGQVGSG
jgi:hypothetical protein